ncbi:hypothetical protein C8R46DRAFT_487773 [Mycena filopes]|nr:hypothetical protein C8R46DRAFT_487773 [Mycena filopes]
MFSSLLGSLPALFSLLALVGPSNADPVSIAVPATPANPINEVHSNFLGISFELSFMTDYFGNDTDKINMPMLNYLAGIRARTGGNPVRIRIGGNSADSSPYVDQSSSPMVQLTPGNFNANDQPVTYNPELWSVMAAVANSVNGVAYVINVPLGIQPNKSISDDIRRILGSNLDSMLLGNEPDLYSGHGKRQNLKNYTVDDYIGEYTAAIATIGPGDSAGNPDIGGPSVCCNWDLRTLLQQGYLGNFTSVLKYIVLQHYPQNNCGLPGSAPYGLPWYLQHSNVVNLAKWQSPGIEYLFQQPAANRPLLINSEFNSASCGGVPFSPSFAVGSLWSVDYALQMATVGYSQAYLHTREAGISYNLLAPPAGPPGSAGSWTTNAPYYALLVVAEALRTDHGAYVADLDLGSSKTNAQALSSAYAVYNAGNNTVSRLVIFNYANSSQEFQVPASVFSSSGTALVKFLSAATPQEVTNIAWGGETWGPGVSDGKTTLSPSWATPNVQLTGCTTSGCTFTAPGPSLAMVFLDNAQSEDITAQTPVITSNGTNSTSGSSGSDGGAKGKGGAAGLKVPLGALLSLVTLAFFSL